jgi:hypothetical protein
VQTQIRKKGREKLKNFDNSNPHNLLLSIYSFFVRWFMHILCVQQKAERVGYN